MNPDSYSWKWQNLKPVSLILGSFAESPEADRLVGKHSGSAARPCGRDLGQAWTHPSLAISLLVRGKSVPLSSFIGWG